eukprot:655607-Prorocentrum_minimum.AAC.1
MERKFTPPKGKCTPLKEKFTLLGTTTAGPAERAAARLAGGHPGDGAVLRRGAHRAAGRRGHPLLHPRGGPGRGHSGEGV